MAFIFISFVQTINELGMGSSIIQKKDIDDNHFSTAFWLTISSGIILCIATIFLSPYIADFFNEEQLQPVLSILSFGFIFGTIGSTHRSLLMKNVKFKDIAISEIISGVLLSLISITLALIGFGVWSLVIGSLSGNITKSILLWTRCPWKPSFSFQYEKFLELFHFGKHVMGSRILNYISSNSDYLIIAKVLDATSLGLYTFAFNIAIFPLKYISQIVTRVTFPVFSSIQDDNAKLRYGYLQTLKYVSLITFPFLGGLAIIAPEFVPLVLGPEWIDMTIPLQILCIAGAVKSIGTQVGSILLSKGRSDIQFYWNIITAAIYPIAILIGINFGLIGVAFAVSICSFSLYLIIQNKANQLISLSFTSIFNFLLPSILGTILMIVTILYLKTAMQSLGIEIVQILIFSILSSIASYILIIHLINKNIISETLSLLKTSVRK